MESFKKSFFTIPILNFKLLPSGIGLCQILFVTLPIRTLYFLLP